MTQEEFDKIFMNSGELATRLNISVSALSYLKRYKTIPTPIIAGKNCQLWVRETMNPIIEALNQQNERAM